MIYKEDRTRTIYEWGVSEMSEYQDDDGSRDIVDTDHYDILKDIPDKVFKTIDCDLVDLEVAWIIESDSRGMIDRSYAYAHKKDGKLYLDEYFENGRNVPKKLHEELRKRQL